jgi:hypothetical protein
MIIFSPPHPFLFFQKEKRFELVILMLSALSPWRMLSFPLSFVSYEKESQLLPSMVVQSKRHKRRRNEQIRPSVPPFLYLLLFT